MNTAIAKIIDRPSVGQRVVRPEDFVLGAWEPIESEILLADPNLSLYCVDFSEMALWFTETPDSVDVHNAAFMFEAQRSEAKRIVKIPLHAAHQISTQAGIDPSRIILVNSVGRCGSTLVSRALSAFDGVASLSEPDVFTQLVGTWGRANFYGRENESLLRDCTILQCLPTKLRGRTHWALKFRSYVTTMAAMHARAVPQAKQVFLYRALLPWFKSFVKMLGGGDLHAKFPNEEYVRFLASIVPQLEGRTDASFAEVVVAAWIGTMESALNLVEAGLPVFLLRYEELVKSPESAMMALAEFCELGAFEPSLFESALTRDSQEGTVLSRSSVGDIKVDLDESDIQMIEGYVKTMSSRIQSTSLVPGTFTIS
ncbi:MAG TPA: hypothetical protein VGL56_14955 [Fimbriimonadaceae bacterium]